MKLIDLDAHLVIATSLTDIDYLPAMAAVADAHGVMFECPKCHNHSVLVWFKDRPQLHGAWEPLARWTATGHTLHDLTLTPSINLDTPGATGCKWHGWLMNGDAA